jgi:osmotically-inducible protein OsmY
MTDTKITASVQSKLTADRVSNFSRVDVDTERGVVNLSGVVPSADQKSRAEELARQVNGVTRINNNLQIQSSNR